MNKSLLVFLITLTALPWTSCQDAVPIQFQTSPVLVASGSNAVFTVQTVTNVFSITWLAPRGGTLGNWIGGQAVLNSLSQYQGRVDISATQLRINGSRLSDAGNYTVTVTPAAATGLSTNSRSVTLTVFDAVGPVSLFVPSLAIEGGNVSLSCSWSKGTETRVAWSKGGTELRSDPRININGGSLNINPANRNDSGRYACTVSNPVSAQSAAADLTVNYGPDSPQMTKTSSSCVGGGDATVGQTVRLTCTSVSLPPAVLSWRFNGQLLASGGALSLPVFSTNQSGQYVCSASNGVTMKTSQQQIGLSIVGTCLSAGAVAGIVVGCFVALVLIIVAVVLIVRQRRVDRRLKNVIRQQEEHRNNRPTSPAALPNGYHDPERPVPPPHNEYRLDQPPNQQNTTNIQRNEETQRQNRPTNNNMSQNNNVRPEITDGNSQSSRNRNNQSNSRARLQQNPNILIQTGHGEPGTQTVLINLNTGNTDTQPPTVQVSLPGPQQHNNQQSNANHQLAAANQNDRNVSHQNAERSEEQNHHQHVRNQSHTEPASHRTRDQRETGHNYSNNRDTNTNRVRYQPDPSADDRSAVMPWDRVHDTPAYPNHHEDSSDTDESRTSSLGGSVSERVHPGSNRTPRGSTVSTRTARNHSRRDVLRQLAQGAAHRRFQTVQQQNGTLSPSVRTQDVSAPQRVTAPRLQTTQTQTPSVRTQDVSALQRVTAPRVQANQTQTPSVRTQDVSALQRVTAPRVQTTQTSTPTGFTDMISPGPDHRPTFTSNPVPLTQAALQEHTIRTSHPFSNTPHQTQAAPQHLGTRPTTLPARQVNHDGQAVPTPPPVLRPAEFKTLPREPLQQPRPLQTIRVMKRPAVWHHRPHNVHTHPTDLRHAHRHPTNPHTHSNTRTHTAQPRGFL